MMDRVLFIENERVIKTNQDFISDNRSNKV